MTREPCSRCGREFGVGFGGQCGGICLGCVVGDYPGLKAEVERLRAEAEQLRAEVKQLRNALVTCRKEARRIIRATEAVGGDDG